MQVPPPEVTDAFSSILKNNILKVLKNPRKKKQKNSYKMSFKQKFAKKHLKDFSQHNHPHTYYIL
jgi:hypothetical protein